MGHDVGEDEEEEQGVHDDADEEGEEFAAEDVEVAQEEAGEGAEVAGAFAGGEVTHEGAVTHEVPFPSAG